MRTTGGDLPTFLVIGAQKAATTTLWHWLDQHPDVFVPRLKEAEYFVDEGRWGLGPEWYRSLFAEGAGHRHRGEVSPGYTMAPLCSGAAERIAELLPEVRLIYIVRDPIERMRSAYAETSAQSIEHRPLERALIASPHYLLPSLYGLQVERYRSQLDAGRLLVLSAEDIGREPAGAIDAVLRHLDLAPGWRPADLSARLNRSVDKRVVRRRLRGTHEVVGRRISSPLATRALDPRRIEGRVLSRPLLPEELHVPDRLRARLREVIDPDAARFLSLTGVDPWGASPTRTGGGPPPVAR